MLGHRVVSSFVAMLRLIRLMVLEIESVWQQSGLVLALAMWFCLKCLLFPALVYKTYHNVVFQGWAMPNKNNSLTFGEHKIIVNPISVNQIGIFFLSLAIILSDTLQTPDKLH